MKFSMMVYTRPDKDAYIGRSKELIARLTAAESFDNANEVLLEYEKLESEFETMYSLANIRHDINTADEFYDSEVEFFDAVVPELTEYSQNWTSALLDSQFRSEFESKYGTIMFVNAEMSLKTFSTEIIEELQRENALITEYDKLIASAQIAFDGGTYTLSQLSPFKTDADDSKRLRAWQAEAGFYKDNQGKLDTIYDELVHLRDTMGKKLGFDDYTQLGYYRMTRNCYTQADIDKFRSAVVKYVVPIADGIYKKQAQRLGKEYPMNFADNALEFRSGNPRPQGDPDAILKHGREFYHELSSETAEFIDFLYDNELLDVLSRTGKSGGGYCTTLPDYKAPFIFANFNGTSGDVEVITHEAGHAFAAYVARDIIPSALQSPSMETCEVHSMSMEFFAWPWAEGFFGEDTQKFYYAHLSSALTFIPYGTMVDHFQHEMYKNTNMTPAQRHDTWRDLMSVYMPWMKLGDEIPFYGEGQGWQRQSHIYQVPFYYIDYCLAQTMSLQFWAKMIANRDEAFKTYMAFVRQAGKGTFKEILQNAGLTSPFGDDALQMVCHAAEKWLDSFNIDSIK